MIILKNTYFENPLNELRVNTYMKCIFHKLVWTPKSNIYFEELVLEILWPYQKINNVNKIGV